MSPIASATFRAACYFSFRFFAQYSFILGASALLFAADLLRFLAGAVGITPIGFFGGLPRLFSPCKASMARSSFSRSAIRRAMMCSVGIS
jgi:hypothetical protein